MTTRVYLVNKSTLRNKVKSGDDESQPDGSNRQEALAGEVADVRLMSSLGGAASSDGPKVRECTNISLIHRSLIIGSYWGGEHEFKTSFGNLSEFVVRH